MAIFDIFQDLVVRQALEWKGAECNYLVEKNSVAPDVRHRGEYPVRETLRRHPSDWQLSFPAEPVELTVHDGPSHPEVSQLHISVRVHEAVPAGYVSMDVSGIIFQESIKSSFSAKYFPD